MNWKELILTLPYTISKNEFKIDHRPQYKRSYRYRHRKINLCDVELIKDFLTRIQKALLIKDKIDKIDFNNIKNLCSWEYTMKEMKRQVIDWGKIFAKHMSVKGLVSRIYKEFLEFHSKQMNSIKIGKRFEQISYTRRCTDGKAYENVYSTSIVIRVMQIKPLLDPTTCLLEWL